MTPIPFDLPRRTLPPAVAYAAGLICQHRPDLADLVRPAAIGGDLLYLGDRGVECSERGDRQGARVCDLLHGIMLHIGNEKHRERAYQDLRALGEALSVDYQWGSLATPGGRDLDLGVMYLRFGFAACWKHAATASDLHDLRRVVTLHAHTVSLDPDARAAWAKAHLDALTTHQEE